MRTITATTYNQTPGKALHIVDMEDEVTVTVRGQPKYVVVSESLYASLRAQAAPLPTLLEAMREIGHGLDLDSVDDALFERDRSELSLPRASA